MTKGQLKKLEAEELRAHENYLREFRKAENDCVDAQDELQNYLNYNRTEESLIDTLNHCVDKLKKVIPQREVWKEKFMGCRYATLEIMEIEEKIEEDKKKLNTEQASQKESCSAKEMS